MKPPRHFLRTLADAALLIAGLLSVLAIVQANDDGVLMISTQHTTTERPAQ
jgi:hypothetical protein